FTDQGSSLAKQQDDLLRGLDERCTQLEKLLARHHTRMAELDDAGREDLQVTGDERVLEAGERNVERLERHLEELLAGHHARMAELDEAARNDLHVTLDERVVQVGDRNLGHLERRLDSIEEQIAASAASRLDDAAEAPAEVEQPPIEEPPAQPAEHLLLVPGPSGYSLVERTGAPPPVGACVELSGARSFVVAKLGPSPLPRDARSCSHLERTTVREQVGSPAASSAFPPSSSTSEATPSRCAA